jgi:hypothetical protein
MAVEVVLVEVVVAGAAEEQFVPVAVGAAALVVEFLVELAETEIG